MRGIVVAAATVCLVLGLAACSSDDGDGDDATVTAEPTTASAPPTEERAPSQEPLGSVEADAYTAETALPQLTFDRMVEIEAIPGTDDAVVITQDGMVQRFSLTDESVEPTAFLDVMSKIITDPGNEEGLLGIAFDPDFESTSLFYIYYSAGPPRQTILERYTASGDAADPASGEVLLRIDDPFSNHNGGALEFGPDGYLYLGVGDGGSGGDPEENGQDTNALLGKILRFDVAGDGISIPSDNPFESGGGAPEIFAYGFRNPWRFSFDRETGDLWVGDVGQNTWEEVGDVTIGGNYGWNIMEGDECFEAESCDQAGLTLPRAVYGRDFGCSVTGGYVYRGDDMPELEGWYVYGDYCTGNIWALDTSSDDSEPVLIAETGLQIPSFWQDADGEIYILTFNNAVAKLARR